MAAYPGQTIDGCLSKMEQTPDTLKMDGVASLIGALEEYQSNEIVAFLPTLDPRRCCESKKL
jgi:hypothetical protein